jgi:2-oxoglutarate dehydrogenase E2 component (dihydrolipoamide succinyltransferase)
MMAGEALDQLHQHTAYDYFRRSLVTRYGGRVRRPTAAFLSPVVRRLVAEHAIDPAQLTGTGADGRVTRNDVLAAVAARARASPDVTSASAVTSASVAPISGERSGDQIGDQIVQWSPMRKRIAEHMLRSVATSPHAYTSVVVDLEGVERVRAANGARWRAKEGFTLTYLPFVARAVVDALREHPLLNASVVDDGLVVHRSVHLGIAVDLDREGLVVPVIPDADVKRLRGIARDGAALARAAREGGLSPGDLVGGTITITNPGPFGTVLSIPIINQPQVAIVVMDRVRRVPVVAQSIDGTDGIAIHAVATLGLAFDHRVVGLGDAAAFLDAVRQILESRDWGVEL